MTEGAAAAAGGMMTVCEMPNTVPPTTTIEALAGKVSRAAMAADVLRRRPLSSSPTPHSPSPSIDIRLFFGITQRAHVAELRRLWTNASLASIKARCCGVKLYLDHSTGDQKVETALLDDIFAFCADQQIVVVCHCENPEINAEAAAAILRSSLRLNVALHSQLRPPESEVRATEYAIALARTHGTRLHIAHLSTRGALEAVRAARSQRLSVTCEVAPHHLFLIEDDYATLGAFVKVNPPLRGRSDQQALWEGIRDGTVDCIGSDHAPHSIEEKHCGDPLKAPSGMPGVETTLPLLLTVAAGVWPHPNAVSSRRSSVFNYDDIVRLCFTNPNRIFALGKSPQDCILDIDPAAEWVIRAADLHSKCGWTPYEGWRVRGKITRVHAGE